MKKKIFLSPATINLYRECPRCFYLHMKYDIKRPRGPMPSIATGMDSVLKKYFDYYRSIKELPPELKDEMEGHLIEKLKPTYYTDIKNGYCLLGKLDDCLITEKSTYIPLDFKTRASVAEDIHPAYQLQMELYCMLLEGNGMKTEDIAYLLYYYPLNVNPKEGAGNILFGMDIKKVSVDMKNAKDIIESAIGCLERKEIPVPSEECEYCRWIERVYGRESLVGIPIKKDEKPPEPEEIIKEEEYKDTLF
ncbi:MAG: PD-(D/E)XK nuclease family protein [Candidatus Omnitrophica bacterium]|nr:PD-(D/E)XK nuclease family protein [Candidatus Omnitrophota bacterium]